MLSGTLRRCAAFAAAFGIALLALWPAIVQARPADSISVPICSADGTRHDIELPLGKTQDGSQHCKLCVLGDGKPAVAFRLPLLVVTSFSNKKPETSTASFLLQALIPARSRAPPQAS